MMADYINLLGAEQVQRAGHLIADAAEHMANVSSNIQLTFEAHQRFLDDWLRRFEAILEKVKPNGQ